MYEICVAGNELETRLNGQNFINFGIVKHKRIQAILEKTEEEFWRACEFLLNVPSSEKRNWLACVAGVPNPVRIHSVSRILAPALHSFALAPIFARPQLWKTSFERKRLPRSIGTGLKANSDGPVLMFYPVMSITVLNRNNCQKWQIL